jgi:integrase
MSNVKTRAEPAKQLTDAAVKQYRPMSWRRMIPDKGATSLFLVIYPSSKRSWVMRFRVAGRICKLVLGSVDLSGRELEGAPTIGQPLSLAAARSLAAEVLRQRELGHDPAADRRTAKKRQRAKIIEDGTNTFGVAVKDFVHKHSQKRVRRWQEQARMLGLRATDGGLEVIEGGLVALWGDRPLSSIDGHDIFQVVDNTKNRGAPGLKRRSTGSDEGMARHMLSHLSSLFGWLVRNRRIERNPCVGVHRPEPPRARERVLSNDEIVAFWKATESGDPFASCLRLLLLTGCRLREISELRWDEISADGGMISLPGTRTKNGKPHIIPLSGAAREIISSVRRIDGSPFVFTLTGAAIRGWSRAKSRIDAEMKIPPWRIHDLRRTMVTGMVELGVAPHIVELCVNHIGGARAGVAGVYNRASMIDERRAALERWARHVEGLVSGKGDNVVAMPTGRNQKR